MLGAIGVGCQPACRPGRLATYRVLATACYRPRHGPKMSLLLVEAWLCLMSVVASKENVPPLKT